MANVKLIEESDAAGNVKEIYRDIKETFGVLPALFKAMGSNPELLAVNWARVMAILTRGKLDRKTKEFIAVAVSATKACTYCSNAHTALLKHLGATDEEIVEALAVADLVNGFNAFATGVDME